MGKLKSEVVNKEAKIHEVELTLEVEHTSLRSALASVQPASGGGAEPPAEQHTRRRHIPRRLGTLRQRGVLLLLQALGQRRVVRVPGSPASAAGLLRLATRFGAGGGAHRGLSFLVPSIEAVGSGGGARGLSFSVPSSGCGGGRGRAPGPAGRASDGLRRRAAEAADGAAACG